MEKRGRKGKERKEVTLTIKVEKELWKRYRTKLLKEEKTVKEHLTECIRKYLGER